MRDFPLGSLRQETPSPTSQLNTSFSSNGGPKPPTPTGSPKLRPKMAGGDQQQQPTQTCLGPERNPLRENMDMLDSDLEDEEIEEELDEVLSETPESPVGGEHSISPPNDGSSSSPSPVPSSPKDQSGSERVRSKAVSKTQNMRESLVQKFASGSDKSSTPTTVPTAIQKRPPVIDGSQKVVAKSTAQEDCGGLDAATVESKLSDETSCSTARTSAPTFGSHPVSRSGVVVPDSSTNYSAAASRPPSGSTADRESPSPLDQQREKKFFSSSSGSNGGCLSNKNRPSRLRRNVQVLPDKNLLKEKTNSNEHLSEPVVVGATSSGNAPVRKRTDGSGSSAEGSDHNAIVTHTPRPPLSKRPVPTTDSDDNSENDCCSVVVVSSRPPLGSSNNSSSNDLLAVSPAASKTQSTRCNRSAGGIIKRTSRVDSGIALQRPPEDTDECDSLNEEILHVQSDGEATSSSSPNKTAGHHRRTGRLKTGSQELPTILNSMEKRTAPLIRQPAARQSRQQPVPMATGIAGLTITGDSPPKTVTWNLRPDVVNYDRSSEAPPTTGRGNQKGGSAGKQKGTGARQGSRHVRRHSTDERIERITTADMPESGSGKVNISPEMEVMVHESFLEQSNMIMSQQKQVLTDVKEGRKCYKAYREVTLEILSIHEQSVKRMLQFIKKSTDS